MALSKKFTIGWCEWCALPGLDLPAIKAKIDTGAKTSALHAFNIKTVKKNRKDYVKFSVHPLQGNSELALQCMSEIIDVRHVMSSNGHMEERYVIEAELVLGNCAWVIDLTLSNRDPLRFRMLLGRSALKNKVIIDPGRMTLARKVRKNELEKIYI